MRKILLVLPVIFLLAGCAALQGVVEELPTLNPAEEISAVNIVVDDFVKEPYQNAIAIGVGYALAILRRMYKKKKGCKS